MNIGKNGKAFHNNYATPKYIYEPLDAEFNFDFDPCPLNHNIEEWDGLQNDITYNFLQDGMVYKQNGVLVIL